MMPYTPERLALVSTSTQFLILYIVGGVQPHDLTIQSLALYCWATILHSSVQEDWNYHSLIIKNLFSSTKIG